MIIYLAGSIVVKNVDEFDYDCSVLETFYDYHKKYTEYQPTLKKYNKLILDSGAFTFFNPDRKTNWEDYIEKYCYFINLHDIDLFFEFDIDIMVGLKQVEKYRAKIEQLTNKKPIPVWRPSRGIEYWKYMVANYPYVAISASGKYDSAWTRAKGSDNVLRQMVMYAHKRGVKVHGLGYTSIPKLKYIGWDSVDSTAWIMVTKFGSGIYQYEHGGLKKINKPKGNRLVDSTSQLIYNFKEWAKFQRYAEQNL